MKPVKERLIDGIEIVTESGCWIWMRSTIEKGYGRISVKQKSNLAHRASYREFVGEIPDGMCVLHRCDNPPCINPDHLFLGTHMDNTKDKIKKGRQKCGFHNSANTKEKDVLFIRRSNENAAVLAERFNLTSDSIGNIRNYKTWKNIK